jgi:hypothetical protein
MSDFLDQNGLGQVLLSLKQQERETTSATTVVNVITAEGTSNTLFIWIGYASTEPENLPDGALKFYLKQ